MAFTVAELAKALDATCFGDASIRISRPASPQDAGSDDLLLAMEKRYAPQISGSDARAAVLWEGADWQAMGILGGFYAPRSRYTMAGLTQIFDQEADVPSGIHASAVIDGSARIAEGASIGPFCVIGADVQIGPQARVHSHVTIAESAVIGSEAIIQAGVRIMRHVTIGHRVRIHANAVLGSDGFSFVTPKPGAIEEARTQGAISGLSATNPFARIHSIGGLEIGDDVEIGAGTCIDRGTVASTRIGAGTKIDNLVQIGHNVQIGQTSLICGQVGIAGSVTMGDRVVLGGRVGVADHMRIGSDVVIAGGSLVGTNVPARSVMMGIPATSKEIAMQGLKNNRRLPGLFDAVDALKKRVSKLDPSG